MAQGGSIVWNLDIDDAKFKQGLDSASLQAEATAKKINNIDFKGISENAGRSFEGIADAIKRTVLVVGALGLAVGGTFIKSAAELEQTSRSFEVLTGNAEVARKLFAKIADFAAKTPFEFPELAKSAQTLLGFGRNANQAFGDLQVLGDIAAATGADLKSLAVVFGQVNATGKLMGQDALQLINNNIPITTILAKKLGVSVQDVRKKMEAGAISADLFNEALVGVTKEGGFAFKGTDKLATTLNGRLSTLKDTVLEFGRNLLGVKIDPELGLVIKPGGVFDKFSLLVPKITEALTRLAPKASAVFEGLINNGPLVLDIVKGIIVAFVGFKILGVITPIIGVFFAALTGGASVAGAALVALGGPITLIGIALVGLATVIIALNRRFNVLERILKPLQPVFDIFKKVLAELGKAASELGKVLSDILSPVFDFLASHMDGVRKVAIALGVVAFSPLIILAGALLVAIKALTFVFQGLAKVAELVSSGYQKIVEALSGAIAGAITTATNLFNEHRASIERVVGILALVFGPLLLKITTQAVASAVRISTAWVVEMAKIGAAALKNIAVNTFAAIQSALAWTVNAVRIGATWIAQFVIMNAQAIATAAIMTAQAVISGFVWVFNALRIGAVWVAQFVIMIAQAIATGVVMTAQAAISGFAWVFNAIKMAPAWIAQFAVIVSSAISTAATMTAQAVVASAAWIGQAIKAGAAWIAQMAAVIVQSAVTTAAFVANAVRMGAAWLVSLGPIGLVISAISAVAAGAFLIIKNWDKVSEFFRQVGSIILGALGNLGSLLFNGGRDLIQGLINGIISAKDAVVNVIKNIAKSSLDTIKNFFGIRSPSTVMSEQGKFIIQGLAQGMTKNTDFVDRSVQDVTGSIMDGLIKGQNLLATAGDLGSNIVKTIGDSLSNSTIPDSIKTVIPKFIDMGSQIVGGLKKGIEDSAAALDKSVENVAGNVVDKFNTSDTNNLAFDVNGIASGTQSLNVNNDTQSAQEAVSTAPSNIIEIHVGAFAGTPQELRTFAEKLQVEMNRLSTARGA